MKKLCFLISALFVFTGGNAQKIVTDDVSGVKPVESSTNHGPDEKVNYLNSGTGLDYLFIEDGYGLAFNMAFKYVLVDLAYRSAGNDYFDSTAWSIGLGGQYRYWFSKWFYIEGRVGLQLLSQRLQMIRRATVIWDFLLLLVLVLNSLIIVLL